MSELFGTKLTMNLGERSYDIILKNGALENLYQFARLDRRVAVVTDTGVPAAYAQRVADQCKDARIITVPQGEGSKSFKVLESVLRQMLDFHMGRGDLVIAVGGGVVGDLTGFAAASYQRGVRFIQVPTTLLSQVDSSVGGKTAVNHPLGKNMIGAFYQPASVVVDLDCLKTLPPRELASGLAEVIKYGIILDGAFFNWLEENLDALLRLDGPAMAYCIRRCCELKAEVVAADERETGLRALLNLGHTFGHAIEAEMGYGNWLHGEAVAAGMVMAARTSERLGQFSSAETQRIITLLTRAGLPVNGPREMSAQAYLPHMLRDKKVLAGEMRLILPLAIGKSEVRSGVSHELVLNAIADCQSA